MSKMKCALKADVVLIMEVAIHNWRGRTEGLGMSHQAWPGVTGPYHFQPLLFMELTCGTRSGWVHEEKCEENVRGGYALFS